MNSDNAHRKPPSPRSSTEVVSLQNNRRRNQEALERGLQCRRSVKDLVNQGILLNPTICNPVKVKQLQRQKTADMLKRKIEKRPDKQVLINHRILRPDETGTSAFILERCHALTKNQLCESLNSKLDRRPGSLELVEKGVLQVDPGVANLIRGGSIPYPRVSSTSPIQLYTVPENEPIIKPPSPPPPPVNFAKISSRNSVGGSAKSRTSSRSLKDETVISRYGSLVFHNYRPSSAASSTSPSLRAGNATPSERLPKHRAREVQQAELLKLEDASQVHRKVGQEICQLKGCPPHRIAQNTNEEDEQQQHQQQISSPILAAAQSQTPHPLPQPPQQQQQQQCFLFSTPSAQQTPDSVTMITSPQPTSSQSNQQPQPPPDPFTVVAADQVNFPQLFSNRQIFDDGSGSLVALNSGGQTLQDHQLQQQQEQQQTQHQIVSLAPPSSTKFPTAASTNTEPIKQAVPSLEQIETVWLDLRRLQHEIIEEASHYGLNIVSSDGFPGAFCVATANESEVNSPAYQRLRDLSNQHNRLCSLARLLIRDRLDYLDQTDPFLQHPDVASAAAAATAVCSGGGSDQMKPEGSYCNGGGGGSGVSSKGGSDLERSLLQSYLSRLGGNYQRFGATHLRRPRHTTHHHHQQQANGAVNGAASSSTGSNPCWRNSTILPAHSGSVFYQQQMQLEQQQQQQQQEQSQQIQQQIYQSIPQKMNGSLVELASNAAAADDGSWQHIFSSGLQTINSAVPVTAMMTSTTTPPVGHHPLIHATSSMPANLHLVNATMGAAAPATAMILGPADVFHEITNGDRTSVGNSVHVAVGGGGGGVFMPSSVGGSSGSSGPAITAESSSCSIPAAMVVDEHRVRHYQDNLMSLEFSPDDMPSLPTHEDENEEIPQLLDVENFLNKCLSVNNDEEGLMATIGLDSNNSNSSSISNNNTNSTAYNNTDFNSSKNDHKLPPGPLFFHLPEQEDFWNFPGLMDTS